MPRPQNAYPRENLHRRHARPPTSLETLNARFPELDSAMPDTCDAPNSFDRGSGVPDPYRHISRITDKALSVLCGT